MAVGMNGEGVATKAVGVLGSSVGPLVGDPVGRIAGLGETLGVGEPVGSAGDEGFGSAPPRNSRAVAIRPEKKAKMNAPRA